MNTIQTMTNKEAVEYFKELIEDYLQSEFDVNTKNNFHCIAGTHQDNNPSMGLDRKHLQAHCFSCQAKLDIFDLVEIKEGITNFRDKLNFLCDLYGVKIIPDGKTNKRTSNPIGKENMQTAHTVRTVQTVQTVQTKERDFTELYKKWHENLKECEYLTQRGISRTIQNNKRIGYAPDYKDFATNTTYKALIIPTSKSTYVVRSIDSSAEKHQRYKKIGGSKIYNCLKSYFKDDTPIFIVEGEIDTLSFLEVGAKAIGLGSTANVDTFANNLKKRTTAETCPPLILCLDRDKAGTDATAKLMGHFKDTGYTIINACEGDLCNGNPIYLTYKDANEALVNNRAAFIDNVRDYTAFATTKRNEQVENYKKRNSAFGCLYDFYNGIKAGASTKFIPTGYTELDKILDGGITEGLYVIGAISSLGKTTFTLQMADQIAKAGTDVLIFSLEMAKRELIAKSLSRITYMFGDIDNAKTARGITTSERYEKYSTEELTTIENAVKEYSTFAQNIYIIEGMGDVTIKTIRDAVTEHITLTKRNPVVIVDYVQIVAPESDRLTDKQVIDKSVLGLKRISRDFKIPVIAISSFNRNSYKAEVNMASFKESGALEYGSDVLIGLQLEGTGTDNFDDIKQKSISNDVSVPRHIELKILKNRNGRTGDTINYNFFSAFNFFIERNADYNTLEVTAGKVDEIPNYDDDDLDIYIPPLSEPEDNLSDLTFD